MRSIRAPRHVCSMPLFDCPLWWQSKKTLKWTLLHRLEPIVRHRLPGLFLLPLLCTTEHVRVVEPVSSSPDANDERLPTIRSLRFLAMLVSAKVARKHASTSCMRAMSLRCTLIDLACPAPVHFAQRALPICQTCFIKSVRKKRSRAKHEVAPLVIVLCMELSLDHNST